MWSLSYGSWTYNYLCNQCLSPLTFWVWIPPGRGLLDTTLWDQLYQWLATGRWFSPGFPVSSIYKTDCHNISEILLKAALNTIKLNKTKFKQVEQMFPWLQRLQIFGLFSVILSGYRCSLMQHCLIFISNAFSLSNIIMVNKITKANVQMDHDKIWIVKAALAHFISNAFSLSNTLWLIRWPKQMCS